MAEGTAAAGHNNQPSAIDSFWVAVRKYFLGLTDRVGTPIQVGSLVKVDRYGRSYRWHREFRKAYRKLVGQVVTVVGRDASHGVHIAPVADGVLTLEPRLLKVVGRADNPVASFARRMWPRVR